MGLETGEFLSDLDQTNPITATDPVSEGSNHLRLLKKVLQQTFPSYGEAVTVIPSVLNGLPARVGVNETQIGLNVTAIDINSADIGTIQSDAAFKNAQGTIVSTWSFSSGPVFLNNVPLFSRTVGAALVNLLNVTTADLFVIGGDTIDNQIRANAVTDLRVAGISVGLFGPLADGGIQVRDLGGTAKKAGFRNPTRDVHSTNHSIVQGDENKVLLPNNNGFVLTLNVLEAYTTIMVLTRFAGTIVADAGVNSYRWYSGDGVVDVTTAIVEAGAAIQLYQEDSNSWAIYGNGISV